MLFNIFPMLLTLKAWLIVQAVLGCLAFISTVLIVNFINLEFFEKIEKEALEERKRNNLLFLSIPIFLIICVAYALYVDNFFYMGNEGFVYDFLLSVSSFPLVPLAILCGSQILDGRCISREKSKIIKSKNIYDGDLHEVVDRSNVDVAGSPLIDYIYDGKQEYAMRLKNSDRGVVAGLPGSGKSSLIIMQSLDWMKSGQSIVLTDIKPELYGILKAMNADENFGYKIWVINPLDPHADRYNIFSEAESVADLTEIINILMSPENKDSIVFNDGAKNILLGVLLRMKEKSLSISLPSALDYIRDFDDISDLLRDLAKSNDKSVRKIESEVSEISGNKNLFASVLNALSKAFNFLNTEVIRDSISCNADRFNLKEVLMKPKQIVILQYEMQYKELTKTLFGATVAHIFRILQSNLNRKPVLILLDEIINSAPIPDFSGKLNTIRSMKMPTFLYLQSFEGLNRLYGNNAKTLFMDGCSFYAVFRIGSFETAKDFSNLIGKCETTYISSSNVIPNPNFNGVRYDQNLGSISEHKQMDYILEPNEILKFEDNHAVIIYQGRYQKFHLSKYWEYYDVDIDVETIKKLKSDFA